jgi:hypothetical protein
MPLRFSIGAEPPPLAGRATLAALLVVSALAAHHLGHYLDRARANQRTLLAELMAQPICTGAAKHVEVARREEPATPSIP